MFLTITLSCHYAQDIIPEVLNNTSWLEAPSSPESSYSSAPFSSEDFNEKLLDLPPLLQQTPLDQPSSSAKPLPAVLNHLYIQKSRSSQSMVALSSTHRFRTKYVTAVLYKSLKNLKKWNTWKNLHMEVLFFVFDTHFRSKHLNHDEI